MNLDDLIVADSLAPPTGIANSPSPDLATQSKNKPLRSQINAIPINAHKPRQASLPHFGPQSVPVPPHAPTVQREFGYLTRHHRKTSIDERRVSLFLPVNLIVLWLISFMKILDSKASCRLFSACIWHRWRC